MSKMERQSHTREKVPDCPAPTASLRLWAGWSKTGRLAWVLEHKPSSSPCLPSLPKLWQLIISPLRVSGRGRAKGRANYQGCAATHRLGCFFSNGEALFGERQFVGSSGQHNLWAPSLPVMKEVAMA